jgi:hypothetical protein
MVPVFYESLLSGQSSLGGVSIHTTKTQRQTRYLQIAKMIRNINCSPKKVEKKGVRIIMG